MKVKDNELDINEIISRTGLNSTKFANKYNIPTRTLQNWRLGTRRAPEYLLSLLSRAVDDDFKDLKK